MRKLKLASGIILVFLVGGLTGSLATGMYLKHRYESLAVHGPQHPSRMNHLMRRLSDKLDLKAAQRRAFSEILEDYERQVFSVRREYLPEIREITEQSIERMKAELNRDQRDQLERLHRQLRKRHARAFIRSVELRPGPTPPVSALRERLNLSQSQVEKLREILGDEKETIRGIIDRYKEQDTPDIHALKRDLRKVQEHTEARVAEILDGNQLNAYHGLVDERLRMHQGKRRHGVRD